MTRPHPNDDSETMARLTALLEVLYGASVAPELATELLARVPPTMPRADGRPRGCVLITYADTIQCPGEAPLKTLARFLERYLEGTLAGLHVLPFFPSTSDDGFAVVDYRLVDHHLGSWDDIGALAADYRVMVDLVINHCSRENLWFADFVSGREPGRHYFITLPEESDTSAVIRPRSTPLISAVHTYGGIRHVWNTFGADQVDLDFANPAVLKEFVDILLFYVSQGAAMVRLDAVAFLWKRLGTSCVNLPETHAVVKVLRLLLDHAGADVELVTETNVPHEENVGYFGTGDEAHMVYQFSLAPLLLYAYVFGDASYLTTWAARLQAPPAGCTFLNFLISHDGVGLRPLEGLVPEADVARLVEAMQARGGFVTMREVGPGAQRPYEINVAPFSAFGGRAEDLPAFLGAHALLLSFQGVPALYLHSMLASENDLDLVQQTGRTRSINRGHLSLHDLESELADPSSKRAQVLERLRQVIACRDALPAFAPEAGQRVFPTPPGVFAMQRASVHQTLIVVASVLASPQRISLAGLSLAPGRYHDYLDDSTVEIRDELALAPYQVRWLEARGG